VESVSKTEQFSQLSLLYEHIHQQHYKKLTRAFVPTVKQASKIEMARFMVSVTKEEAKENAPE